MKEGGRGGASDKTTLLFTSPFGLQNLPSGWNLSSLERSQCLPCWAVRATCSLQEVMGIPSFLAFPAARRNQAQCTPWHPWGHMLLWTALLFLAPVAGKPADLPKAVVSIQPAWINVLREDHVTLICQGTSFHEGNLTTWFHNGSSIRTQNQPSYSFKAGSNNSGSYRCQREQTSLSDPVHLDVISGPAIPLIFSPWYRITFCLVTGLLFAVDTGLYFSVQRDLQSSMGDWKNYKVRWSQDPQDK